MNKCAVPTEKEAITYNMKDTHCQFSFVTPDYWVLLKSDLYTVWERGFCGCVFPSAPLLSSFLLFWIPVSFSVINPRPITSVVITEPLRYIQVQQSVGVESHKEVMNKSVLTISSTLQNITPCARTLWQLIEGSPWAECSWDLIIKDPVLVFLNTGRTWDLASYVIIKGILHRKGF